MDHEAEVIRQQMDETRSSLSQKVELLEKQVADTVHGAATAMAETVDSVKEVVNETVESVKHSVQETVASVKNSFDVQRQVEQRPWTCMAGATVVGFVGGYLLPHEKADRFTRFTRANPEWRDDQSQPGNGAPAHAMTVRPSERTEPSLPEQPSWLTKLGETFEAEIAQLKGLAVGTVLGVVRDMVTKSVPPALDRQVEEVIDGFTVKLGGRIVRGPLLTPESTTRDRV